MTTAADPIERAMTAAARRRIDAADRARRWREEQRKADAALRSENQKLKIERDGLRDALECISATASVDEDVARAVVRMGGIRQDASGRLSIARPTVSVADIVAKASLLRSGGKEAGQAAYDEARSRVLARLRQFILPPADVP